MWKTAKTTKTRVYNPKPLQGDNCTGIDPDIYFYEVEGDDKSDIGYDGLIHVKINKTSSDTNKISIKFHFQKNPISYTLINKLSIDEKTNEAKKYDAKI